MTSTHHQKLIDIEKSLNSHTYERKAAIRALLLAFVTQEHCFFFGPPGTAKTWIVEALRDCVSGARSCYRLAHKLMTADEVVGPMDLAVFQKEQKFRRNIEDGICDVEFAFLDEVFKANSAVLNTLLPILNERRLDEKTSIPLRTCASASNEFPSDDVLKALYDRFLIRECVEYIKNDRSKLSLRKKKAGLTKDAQRFSPPCQLTLDEWDAITAEVDAVTIPDAVLEAQIKLESDLAKHGVVISDRRAIQALRVLKAEAWLDGLDEVNIDHIQALRYVYWENQEDRKVLLTALTSLERSIVGEVLNILESALEKWHNRSTDKAAYREEFPTLERELQVALKLAREKAQSFGEKAKAKVAERGKELHDAHAQIRADLKGMYNL